MELPEGFEVVSEDTGGMELPEGFEVMGDGGVKEPEYKPPGEMWPVAEGRGIQGPPNLKIDSGDMMDGEEALDKFSKGAADTNKGMAATAANLGLGAAYFAEGTYNLLTSSESKKVDGWIAENKKYIEDNNLEGETLIAEMALMGGLSSLAWKLGVKSAARVGLVDAAAEVTIGTGAGRSKEGIVTGAAFAFVGGAAGAALINKLNKVNPKSQAAGYMQDLQKGVITEKEFGVLIKDVPKDEQALILAESDVLYKNYFKGAIDKSDITAANLRKRVSMRRDVMKKYTASKAQLSEASKEFGAMRQLIDEQAPSSFVTTRVKNNLDALEKIYKTDPTPLGTTIRNITLDVGEEMKVGTALDLRENINSLLTKPKVSNNAKGNLLNVKKNLDAFIDVALKDRPDLIEIKDVAIGKYKQTINDYNLGELLEKHTKNDFAVDWKALRKDVKKNKLKSDNLDYAMPVLKDFEKRFANDKRLGNLMIPSGSTSQSVLSLLSEIYGGIIDAGHMLLKTDRAHGLIIQKEIRKAINNPSNTHYNDFIDELMENTKIPQKAKDSVQPLVQEIKQIEYNPLAKATGDVNVNPLTATKEGTISADASSGIMKERSDELISNFIAKAGKTDEVAQEASKILQGNRTNEVFRGLSGKLKADDAQGNMKMLQTIVSREADELIKTINKSVGVNLPKSEADKIIKLKLKEMLEECE